MADLIRMMDEFRRKDDKFCRVKLSQEAHKKWLEYSQLVEALMGEDIGHLSHITDWAGKLPGAIARIAGILHLMRCSSADQLDHEVSFEDMNSAVKIGHCLTNHALAVFDLAQADPALVVARSIRSWFLEEKRERFTMRECQRRFRRYKKGDLGKGVAILKEHEMIYEWKLQPEVGRPSDIFEVNPFLLQRGDEKYGQNGQ